MTERAYHAGVHGTVVVENHWPAAIWYLRAVPLSGGEITDLVEGALLPGENHVVTLPAGSYRMVAEAGNGSVFESPVIRVQVGERARWALAGT